MRVKIFNGKQIKIRKLSQKDLKNAKKLQDFINSLIEEGAQIRANRKLSLKQEKYFMESNLRKIKNQKMVSLLAEYNNKIVGATGINLSEGREDHVGNLGTMIRQGYRGIGLGKCLMAEILKLAKTQLKPKPKIIRLSVFPTNKPALALYKKFGFKKAASIPKQIQYKSKLVDEIIMLKEL